MSLILRFLRVSKLLLIVTGSSISSILFCLIPKKRNRWIFSSWFGLKYSDNPKYFYEYCINKGVEAVWLTKSTALRDELLRKNINAAYYLDIKGIYYQLTAEYCFFTHDILADFCSFFISRNTKRCQMWHGVPLKKIGFDDKKVKSKMYFFRGRWGLRYFFNEFYTIVLSSGEKYSNILSNAFGIPKGKFIKTGFPRDDAFIKSINSNKDLIRIVYMPTFRGEVGCTYDILSEIGFDFNKTSRILKEIGAELVIRLHPVNQLPAYNLLDNNNIHFDTNDDGTQLLSSADCLITDFSSVMFDFSKLERPIIFLPFDLNNYVNSDRELYWDYSDVIPRKYTFYKWNDALNFISELDFKSSYINEVPFLASFYDLNRDLSSCENLYRYIKRNQ